MEEEKKEPVFKHISSKRTYIFRGTNRSSYSVKEYEDDVKKWGERPPS